MQMPTLLLTAEPVEEVRPILELQKACKIGCFAVVNLGVDRGTGEKIVDLAFRALEWSDAIAIRAKVRKLAAATRPAQIAVQASVRDHRSSTRAPLTERDVH